MRKLGLWSDMCQTWEAGPTARPVELAVAAAELPAFVLAEAELIAVQPIEGGWMPAEPTAAEMAAYQQAVAFLEGS